MEREFKWQVSRADAFDRITGSALVKPLCREFDKIEMEAIYYDTTDGKIAKTHGGLRVRRENDTMVVCLKLEAESAFDGACKQREEYEFLTGDIRSGLSQLPSVGAPQAFCDELLNSELTELGRSVCVRLAYQLELDACTCELSCDTGMLKRNEASDPISEIELEYKSGDIAAFDAFAYQLQTEFDLQPQPLSKLARILRL